MSRSPEEREAARLERERRRAAREGRTPPPAPVPPAPEPAEPPAPTDDRPSMGPADPELVRHPPEPAHDPQATQIFDVTTTWTDEHAAVAAPPEPEPAMPPEPVLELAQEPQPLTDDVPLGTRRITARDRAGAGRRSGRGRRGGRPPAPPRKGRGGAPGSRKPRARRYAGRALAVGAILLVVLAAWFLWSLYQPGTGDGSGRVAVRVPSGATVGEIGDLLAARGVIDSSFFFGLRAKLGGVGGDLKSGTFRLREDMSYGAALAALQENPPPPPVIRITIPEGRSRGEIAPVARQAGLRGDYLRASRSSRALDPRRYGAPRGATLEGFLFPATYELRRGATAQNLVNQQLLAFRQNLARVNLRYARSKNLTVFDVLTIASMVEREVMVARERPLVAAVIYNRLSQGIHLGIDATIRFEHDNWTEPLKQSELTANTPYNTRTNAGLPPGPIGNPGLASIQAAARPARVGYLYYVVKPGTCGEHAFSSTDAQFQRDVAAYNAAREAAGGKSPTRC